LMPRLKPREAHKTHALDWWDGWSRWLDGQILMHQAEGRELVVQIPEPVLQLLDDNLFSLYREQLIDDYDRVNSARLRGINYAETIASLYALSCGRFVVIEDDMSRAINLVEMCLQTLTRLDKVVAVSQERRLRERVHASIVSRGERGSFKRELYALGASKQELDHALATLLDADEIERVEVKMTGRGRRPELYRAKKYIKEPNDPGTAS
jgi:hypothetical protein